MLAKKNSTIRYFTLQILLLSFTVAFGKSVNFTPPVLQTLDPTLINGRLYTFNYSHANGNQFLSDQDFTIGTITIKGKTYSNQLLKFDIYNQLLLLKFYNQFESEKVIIVSDAWLSDFTIGNMVFKVLNSNDGKKRIVQIYESDGINIMFEWKKELKLDATSGEYRFTKPINDGYIIIGEKEYLFKSNRSFSKIFGKDKSQTVAKFLRKNRIKVNKASDTQFRQLLEYCNTII